MFIAVLNYMQTLFTLKGKKVYRKLSDVFIMNIWEAEQVILISYSLTD